MTGVDQGLSAGEVMRRLTTDDYAKTISVISSQLKQIADYSTSSHPS